MLKILKTRKQMQNDEHFTILTIHTLRSDLL